MKPTIISPGTLRKRTSTWRLRYRLEAYDKRVADRAEMLANAERLDLQHEATRRRKMLDRALAQRAKIAAELLRRKQSGGL